VKGEVLMAVAPVNIISEQEVEVPIPTIDQNQPNRMIINTGIAAFDFTPPGSDKEKTDTLTFSIGRSFAPNQFRRSIVTAALANLFNNNVAHDAGWAIESIDADLDDETGRIEVTAQVFVSDTDGFFRGISFQVTTLARLEEGLPDGPMPTARLHWAYLIDQGVIAEGARVEHSSDPTVSVETPQSGEYIVTFPPDIPVLGCTATMNNSVGFITAVPGENSGLQLNQVRVLTMNPDNSFGPRDSTVVAYY
jgi:hypothetical protein